MGVTEENRQEADKVIHRIVNVKYRDCIAAWKEVKKRIIEDEEAFVSQFKAEWNKNG